MRVALSLNNTKNYYAKNNQINNRQINFQGERDVLALMDFDGTYQDPNHLESRKVLDEGLAELRAKYAKKGINFMPGIITARPKVRLMKENPSPEIKWSITQNGGEIVNGLPTPDKIDFPHWKALNDATGFKAKRVQDVVFSVAKQQEFSSLNVVTIGDVVNNPAASECEYMQPFCIKTDDIKLAEMETAEILTDKNYKTPKQISRFVQKISEELKQQGVQFEINEPYLFKGKPYLMFDIASPYANKGQALEFLLKELDVNPKNLIVAADGGNDIAMMRPIKGNPAGDGRSLIVVGENKSLIESVLALSKSKSIIRPADEPSSIGVLKGLETHLKRIAKRISRLK